MKPFASNFISTFLGVVVASLTVAFFALMWERSSKVVDYEERISIQRTVDGQLADEIGKIKARVDRVEDHITIDGIELRAEDVSQEQEQVQQKLDKAIYREKELRK